MHNRVTSATIAHVCQKRVAIFIQDKPRQSRFDLSFCVSFPLEAARARFLTIWISFPNSALEKASIRSCADSRPSKDVLYSVRVLFRVSPENAPAGTVLSAFPARLRVAKDPRLRVVKDLYILMYTRC